MPIKKSTGLTLAGLLLFTLGGASSLAQEKRLKTVPMPYSNPQSGAQMYKDYCAVCHGPTGRGDGPAVEFLKAPPLDLRTLAQRNNAKYPADHVAATLRFGVSSHAHGTADMPVWGPVFRAAEKGRNEAVAESRIHNLIVFIESLQQK